MAASTFVSFVDGLAACPIVGVTCQLTEPPLSLDTANLPASWVGLPAGENTPLVLCGEYWPTFTAELIVAVEPVGQSRQIENYRDTLAMLDELHTALCNCQPITKTKLTWSIRMDIVEVAGTLYWAAIATVEGSG